MWPAYLAALLLSLPAPPASAAGRDGAPRSALDRPHQGEDAPVGAGRMAAKAALPGENDEDEPDREG